MLGVHPSAVPKMVRRGELTPRASRPSLSRSQILELRGTRRAAAAELVRRKARWRVGPRPPDNLHVWMRAADAAVVLDTNAVALAARARRGRVPRRGPLVRL